MHYATTQNKTVICIPEPGPYSLKTLCGKRIRSKIEDFARHNRLKDMKTCPTCAKRAGEQADRPGMDSTVQTVRSDKL